MPNHGQSEAAIQRGSNGKTPESARVSAPGLDDLTREPELGICCSGSDRPQLSHALQVVVPGRARPFVEVAARGNPLGRPIVPCGWFVANTHG
jgi:hypothetical protein